MAYFVEITSIESDDVVRAFGPYATARRAEKVDNGVIATLDHDRYLTRIVQRLDEDRA